MLYGAVIGAAVVVTALLATPETKGRDLSSDLKASKVSCDELMTAERKDLLVPASLAQSLQHRRIFYTAVLRRSLPDIHFE
jgi:gas vesicle protein